MVGLMTDNELPLRPKTVAAIVLLIVGVVPMVLHNVQGMPAKLANRQKDIQKLSDKEKLKLQQNYLHYQRLSVAQRNNYKQLLEQLNADRQNTGDLHLIAQKYQTWLKSLTVKQIEELRTSSSTEQRVALVERLLQEQESASQVAASPNNTDTDFAPFRAAAHQQNHLLESIANVVRQELDLSPADSDHLNTMSPHNQCLYLLCHNFKRYTSKTKQREFHWPPPRLARLMIDQIPQGSFSSRLQGLEPSRQVTALETVLANAFARDLERQLRPNRLLWTLDNPQERIRERLAPSVQKRISQLPQQERFRVTARELALSDLAEEIKVEVDDLRRVVEWVRANTEFTRLRTPTERKPSGPFRTNKSRSNSRPR